MSAQQKHELCGIGFVGQAHVRGVIVHRYGGIEYALALDSPTAANETYSSTWRLPALEMDSSAAPRPTDRMTASFMEFRSLSEPLRHRPDVRASDLESATAQEIINMVH